MDLIKKFVSVLFVLLIATPAVGTALSLDEFMNWEGREKPGFGEEGKRIPFPEVHFTPEFFARLDAYVSENFLFRDQLVYLSALRDVKLLRSSSNSDVLVGKDGYLFLSETVSGEPLFEDQLFGVVSWLKDFQSSVRACGARPLFVLVPDKKSIYMDKLPWRFSTAIYLNYSRLVGRLSEAEISFVDFRDLLLEAREENEMYSLLDTHWNRYGAYLAFADILESLNLRSVEASGVSEYEREGDLSRMLGLGETEVVLEPVVDLSGLKLSGKVAFYYDSFGLGLLAFFDQAFSQVDKYHIMDVSPNDGVGSCFGGAKYVIVEIVERDISHLLYFIDE